MLHLPPLSGSEDGFEVRSWGDRVLGGLLNPWLNFALPVWLLKRIVSSSRSPIIQETLRCPGSWLSTYQAYEHAPPVDWLDRIALTDPISRALRNRRQVVTRLLAEFISAYAKNGPVTLVGVGAGPGAQFQDAILRSAVAGGAVSAYVIDLHDDAFPFGKQRAAKLGLADVMHYTCGDARHIGEVLPDVRPQIVKLIGLIEYLDDEQALALLCSLHPMLADDGVLLTNSFVDRYNGSPFLVRVMGLRHYYRTEEQVIGLLQQTGFAAPDRFETPMKMYSVLWSCKSSTPPINLPLGEPSLLPNAP